MWAVATELFILLTARTSSVCVNGSRLALFPFTIIENIMQRAQRCLSIWQGDRRDGMIQYTVFYGRPFNLEANVWRSIGLWLYLCVMRVTSFFFAFSSQGRHSAHSVIIAVVHVGTRRLVIVHHVVFISPSYSHRRERETDKDTRERLFENICSFVWVF